ncbi:hypothetical protein HETIRDRAFT_107281, partial [Heterobasidion irregulare TC 32-1]
LRTAGLWEHLSAGDVVCNVGYVPPAPRPASSSAESVWGYPADAPGADADAPPGPWERARDAIQDQDQDQDQDVRGARRAWLVFTGTALVPHAPPAPPPVPDPRALPSPLYYAHLAAPRARPTFARLRLPVPRARLSPARDFGAHEFGAAGLRLRLGLRGDAGAAVDGDADADAELESLLKLVRLPTRVRSPHSPSGVALAKRYVWLARLPGPRRPVPAPAPGSPHSHWHSHLAALPIPPFPRSSTGHRTVDRDREADAEGVADGDGDEDVWAGVGEGWRKEWVLQAEGTVEGRTALLDALRDSARAEWAGRDEAAGRVWEMVVERGAAGCVWLSFAAAPMISASLSTLASPRLAHPTATPHLPTFPSPNPPPAPHVSPLRPRARLPLRRSRTRISPIISPWTPQQRPVAAVTRPNEKKKHQRGTSVDARPTLSNNVHPSITHKSNREKRKGKGRESARGVAVRAYYARLTRVVSPTRVLVRGSAPLATASPGAPAVFQPSVLYLPAAGRLVCPGRPA